MASRITRLIEQLRDPNVDVRETAEKDLRAISGLSKDEALEALLAAANEYPPLTIDPWDSGSSALMRVAARGPDPSFITIVVRDFARYDRSARKMALEMLARVGTEEAIDAVIDLTSEYIDGDVITLFPSHVFWSDPMYARRLYPRLLPLAGRGGGTGFEVANLCFHYFQTDVFKPGELDDGGMDIIAAYDELASRLLPAQQSEGVLWMWEDDYSMNSDCAALLLDLMGYFRIREVRQRLQKTLEYDDPRLIQFAATSLVRLGEIPPKDKLYKAAASNISRKVLFEKLESVNALHLFPEDYNNQEALAESDMVNWLIYPTELDRPPDEMELMATLDVRADEGPATVYLFRFRVHEPHWSAKDGWMAGIAGPYLKSQIPTTRGLGGTFSSFEAWDSKTPREHLEDIAESLGQI